MPELPEVEITRRGLAPHLEGYRIQHFVTRHTHLRWPISPELSQHLPGQTVLALGRRAKYLLLKVGRGTALIHLGMSGSLRLLSEKTPIQRHDHVDVVLEGGQCLRFHDPRRFGAWLWWDHATETHPLLTKLGPEPLDETCFEANWLQRCLKGRRAAIKPLLMDARIVVGVGNIYASEALFLAGIAPQRPGGSLNDAECERLVEAVRTTLNKALTFGGTTLRDFVGGDGQPGYFAQELNVYGRGGQPCRRCGTNLIVQRLGQRSSFSCPVCQR